MVEEEFPAPLRPHYNAVRYLPNVGWCGVHRLLYHWTVHVGISLIGYEDRYCFATEQLAADALAAWDGEGDMPSGWHKHPKTGRRRDPETGKVWPE